MKKLIMTPKTDTITICIPPDWVGKVIYCILKDEQEYDVVTHVSDQSMDYFAKLYREDENVDE